MRPEVRLQAAAFRQIDHCAFDEGRVEVAAAGDGEEANHVLRC